MRAGSGPWLPPSHRLGRSPVVSRCRLSPVLPCFSRCPSASKSELRVARMRAPWASCETSYWWLLSLLARHPHALMRAKGAATFTLSVQQIPGHRPGTLRTGTRIAMCGNLRPSRVSGGRRPRAERMSRSTFPLLSLSLQEAGSRRRCWRLRLR